MDNDIIKLKKFLGILELKRCYTALEELGFCEGTLNCLNAMIEDLEDTKD